MYIAPYAISVKKDVLTDEDYKQMQELSGANAGICYMAADSHTVEPLPQKSPLGDAGEADYFTSSKAIGEKAINRFKKCVIDKHHSVADHVWIELRLSGVSKMLAMWLNLLRFSNTSEKSGRYTRMTCISDNVEAAYSKWEQKCLDYVGRRYPEMPQYKQAGLAKENARFMLGILDPVTTLGYSTSWRCWNYIIDWTEHCWDWACKGGYTRETLPPFYARLCEELESLHDELIALGLRVEGMTDSKYPFPDMLHYPVKDEALPLGGVHDDMALTKSGWTTRAQGLHAFDISNGVCTLTARLSFNAAAQLLRHRRLTVHLYPCLEELGIACCDDNVMLSTDTTDTIYMYRKEYYVKPAGFVEDTSDWQDWVRDLYALSSAENPRIGETVWLKASGALVDILAVVTERSCGGAQFEIRNLAQQLVQRLSCWDRIESLDYADRVLLRKFKQELTDGVRPYTRCRKNKCNTPCIWIKDPDYDM